ncbi:acyl-CoA dehydrogenase family protein [Rhodococcoides yunnanense]|uniref:acyl-CoA dehydrogenase family protein n=1 Tax=Rhodococcoides yunnanense TaxID=278209 RepID=UPI000933E5DD|nr:acyl-CoA dehydrogenase family protein [Rhodococcus yunnanensis]
MDFTVSPQTEQFRTEVREVIRTHFTDDERHAVAQSGTKHSWPLHRGLAAAGMLGAAWPVSEGGQNRSPHEMDALYEEAARAGVPMAGFSTTMLVAETIRRVGTSEQRARVLPRVVAGEILIALGYSEPGVGSDVAAVQTRADRREDGTWVINGEKAFTTTAEEADYVFVLARTDQKATRHRGLSLFLVPTSSEGFAVSAMQTLGGERSNMTFFSDVVVDETALVGDVDTGWQTMLVALDFERGGEFAAEMKRMMDLVSTWATGEGNAVSSNTLRRIGRAATETAVAGLLGSRATSLRAEGRAANLEGTMAKLYATEALQRHSSQLLDALGTSGAARGNAVESAIEGMYRHAFVTTIYGGTSEVLRGVIAERRLGMPRTPRATA